MLVRPTQWVEFFCTMFALYCNLTIGLDCEEDSAKMRIPTFSQWGCYVQGGMKNCNLRPVDDFKHVL